MDVRPADPTEIDHLARVWYDGWQDAHARILPAELARARTLESFRSRMAEALSDVRVVGPPGAPLGFCMSRVTSSTSSTSRPSPAGQALRPRWWPTPSSGWRRMASPRRGWLARSGTNGGRFYEKCWLAPGRGRRQRAGDSERDSPLEVGVTRSC